MALSACARRVGDRHCIWQPSKQYCLSENPGFDSAMQNCRLDSVGASLLQDQVIGRLEGGIRDADTIGPLVWAKLPQAPSLRWPAEVLDPFSLPVARALPQGAVLGRRTAEYALQGGCLHLPWPHFMLVLLCVCSTLVFQLSPWPLECDNAHAELLCRAEQGRL